ncbi:palindromic element RPE2 domain-containing protein [Candidatus Tisiphia endosymbiont of Sialis lutaria]|uniref:palindromic element RPE2 domain-containing protein n=1 Tax=Candidatus Tisiphia endosymbiont of Sialis lutaria TaxID=2029164 RepID=UPI00312C87DC
MAIYLYSQFRELGSRNDGATPISNRRVTSDDVTNFPSIDYNHFSGLLRRLYGLLAMTVSQLLFS